MARLFFILAWIFLLSLTGAAAIGISPPESIVDFKPNLEQSFTIIVLNNADEDVTAGIFAEGALAQYVILPENTTLNIPKGGRAYFSYALKLPESIERPGIHDTQIGVREEFEPESGISAVTAATSRLRVLVPYPGKYLEVVFSADDAEAGKPVNIRLAVTSRSTEIINRIIPEVEISYEENKIYSFTMPEIANLAPSETAERTFKLNTKGYKAGDYSAKARITFDEKETITGDGFRIGTIDINILNYTEEFEIGRINEFNISIMSQWNEDIPNVYADISVMDNGAKIAGLKTPSFSISPWRTETIKAYWDVKESLEPGEYDAEITLHYLNKTSVKQGKVMLKKKAGLNATLLIIPALGILVLFTLINIFFLHRNTKANGKVKTK